MTVITIPRVLRERLSDEGAEALVEIIDKVEERAKDRTIEVVEERFERQLSEEIGKVKIELKEEFVNTKSELRTEIVNMEIKIAQAETRLIRWMFIFWTGQIGILFAFFRK